MGWAFKFIFSLKIVVYTTNKVTKHYEMSNLTQTSING